MNFIRKIFLSLLLICSLPCPSFVFAMDESMGTPMDMGGTGGGGDGDGSGDERKGGKQREKHHHERKEKPRKKRARRRGPGERFEGIERTEASSDEDSQPEEDAVAPRHRRFHHHSSDREESPEPTEAPTEALRGDVVPPVFNAVGSPPETRPTRRFRYQIDSPSELSPSRGRGVRRFPHGPSQLGRRSATARTLPFDITPVADSLPPQPGFLSPLVGSGGTALPGTSDTTHLPHELQHPPIPPTSWDALGIPMEGQEHTPSMLPRPMFPRHKKHLARPGHESSDEDSSGEEEGHRQHRPHEEEAGDIGLGGLFTEVSAASAPAPQGDEPDGMLGGLFDPSGPSGDLLAPVLAGLHLDQSTVVPDPSTPVPPPVPPTPAISGLSAPDSVIDIIEKLSPILTSPEQLEYACTEALHRILSPRPTSPEHRVPQAIQDAIQEEIRDGLLRHAPPPPTGSPQRAAPTTTMNLHTPSPLKPALRSIMRSVDPQFSRPRDFSERPDVRLRDILTPLIHNILLALSTTPIRTERDICHPLLRLIYFLFTLDGPERSEASVSVARASSSRDYPTVISNKMSLAAEDRHTGLSPSYGIGQLLADCCRNIHEHDLTLILFLTRHPDPRVRQTVHENSGDFINAWATNILSCRSIRAQSSDAGVNYTLWLTALARYLHECAHESRACFLLAREIVCFAFDHYANHTRGQFSSEDIDECWPVRRINRMRQEDIRLIENLIRELGFYEYIRFKLHEPIDTGSLIKYFIAHTYLVENAQGALTTAYHDHQPGDPIITTAHRNYVRQINHLALIGQLLRAYVRHYCLHVVATPHEETHALRALEEMYEHILRLHHHARQAPRAPLWFHQFEPLLSVFTKIATLKNDPDGITQNHFIRARLLAIESRYPGEVPNIVTSICARQTHITHLMLERASLGGLHLPPAPSTLVPTHPLPAHSVYLNCPLLTSVDFCGTPPTLYIHHFEQMMPPDARTGIQTGILHIHDAQTGTPAMRDPYTGPIVAPLTKVSTFFPPCFAERFPAYMQTLYGLIEHAHSMGTTPIPVDAAAHLHAIRIARATRTRTSGDGTRFTTFIITHPHELCCATPSCPHAGSNITIRLELQEHPISIDFGEERTDATPYITTILSLYPINIHVLPIPETLPFARYGQQPVPTFPLDILWGPAATHIAPETDVSQFGNTGIFAEIFPVPPVPIPPFALRAVVENGPLILCPPPPPGARTPPPSGTLTPPARRRTPTPPPPPPPTS